MRTKIVVRQCSENVGGKVEKFPNSSFANLLLLVVQQEYYYESVESVKRQTRAMEY